MCTVYAFPMFLTGWTMLVLAVLSYIVQSTCEISKEKWSFKSESLQWWRHSHYSPPNFPLFLSLCQTYLKRFYTLERKQPTLARFLGELHHLFIAQLYILKMKWKQGYKKGRNVLKNILGLRLCYIKEPKESKKIAASSWALE